MVGCGVMPAPDLRQLNSLHGHVGTRVYMHRGPHTWGHSLVVLEALGGAGIGC